MSTDTAVALMAGYSGAWWPGARSAAGWRAGTTRRGCSRRPRRDRGGFAILGRDGARAGAGRPVLLGIGLGNLFPMGIAVAVALAPGGRRWRAGGRWR